MHKILMAFAAFRTYQSYYTASTWPLSKRIAMVIMHIKLLYLLSFSGSVNPNIQFQLSVPEDIATIQNVSLVNKEGNKLGHLQYNPGVDLLPAFDIPENKLSSEPLYLLLTASTHDGKYSWIRGSPQQQRAIHS